MHWQIIFLIIRPLLSAQMLFTSVRCKAEKQNINFTSENVEVYNRSFSLEELQDALRRAHDTSTGPDKIHYQLLKHLPDASLLLLLNILKIKSGSLLNFLLIGGKLYFLFQNLVRILLILLDYRHIALTSCICKTMERVINCRLVSRVPQLAH